MKFRPIAIMLIISFLTVPAWSRSFVFDFSQGNSHAFSPIFRDLPLPIYQEYLRRKVEGSLGPRTPLERPAADYDEDVTHWLLNSGIYPLPDGLNGLGFLLQGDNHSDDLDHYLVRKFSVEDGIKPNKTYQIKVTVDLAGDAPIGAFGVGGDPELIIQAAMTKVNPLIHVVDDEGYVRHPDGTLHTSRMARVGTNGVCRIPLCPKGRRILFKLKKGQSSKSISITTDKNAQFWLMVGGHSGFEAFTGIYYTKIKVSVQ